MIIQTHNGKIHADETVAIALLINYYNKKNYEVTVLRSRDPAYFYDSDILVDVGGIYDPDNFRFDHHQSDFHEKWTENSETHLSSAGLIWRHYGKEIVEMYLDANSNEFDCDENYNDEIITEIVNLIYEKLFLEIDANDNGILLQSSSINIPDIINSMNCEDTSNDEIQKENFNKAIELVNTILDIKFKEIIKSYFNFPTDLEKVRSIVDMQVSERQYLIVSEKIPTIFKCLNVLDPSYKIKFVIFAGPDEYTIKTRSEQKFAPIVPIVSEELTDVIFIHKGGFLAKTRTLEAAEKLVGKSLECVVKSVPEPIPESSSQYRSLSLGVFGLFLIGSIFYFGKGNKTPIN